MILNYPPFLLMDPKCYVGYHVLSFPDYEFITQCMGQGTK